MSDVPTNQSISSPAPRRTPVDPLDVEPAIDSRWDRDAEDRDINARRRHVIE